MKFVVIDDDPTGSQTVHDCLLLLKWDRSTLVKGFESKSNLFFILANTRSLSENDAKSTIKEICKNLKNVITSQAYEEEIIFISRGDSTLRGHNYLEPIALNSCLGPFDATFHIPAFIEGKRLTINGVILLIKLLLIKQYLQKIKFLDMRQVMSKIFYFNRVNRK